MQQKSDVRLKGLSPYSAAFTREQFLFYEMRTTARLVCEGLAGEDVVDRVAMENLFQYPTERSVRKMAHCCVRRLAALGDESLVRELAVQPAEVAKQICLYAMMKQYRVVWDFMITVVGEKYRLQDVSFGKRDLNVFFIAEESFQLLRQGVEAFVNETNFKRYIMIVKSTGIVHASLVRSQNVLNFGYILYLTLKDQKMDAALIEKLVRKWIVLSMLTGRYSSSPETAIDYDIKRFTEQDPVEFIKNIEAGELSDAFWNYTLVTRLDTSVASSPYFLVFLMAQVKRGARGFLSEQITIQSLIEQRGDIHHIFPKKFLQKNGVNNRKDYNQIANYVYIQSEINIRISDTAPCKYMEKMLGQVAGEGLAYGGIMSEEDLKKNLAENCVPEEFVKMDIWDYAVFLEKRRTLMAQYIRDYYKSLD